MTLKKPVHEAPVSVMTQSTQDESCLLHPAVICTAFFFWYELVLKFSIGNPQWWPSLIHVLFFSVFCGSLLWIMTSFSKKERVNRLCRGTVFVLIAVLFLVNYFVFCQFKVFYDIRTVTAGAADALGEFRDLVMSLIFSRHGILHILLYLTPCVLYFLYGKKIDRGETIRAKSALQGVLAACIAVCASLGTIALSPFSRTAYYRQFHFPAAVSSFGLLNSLSRDLVHIVSGDEIVFEETEEAEVPEEQENRFTIYQPNQLEIDFEAISASGNALQQRMDQYVQSQKASKKNKYTGMFQGKNLILITAEAFSGYLIDETLTPTLYRLANNGFRFTDFTQPSSAGTTGGEYEVLFGTLPTSGGLAMKRTKDYHNLMTIGAQLDRLGYEGWAFHNNNYTFYDRHLTHNNLGYSNGFMGYGSGMEAYVTDQWPQSDLEMFQGTMPLYLEQDKPFSVYYMTVSGHNGYLRTSNAMTWKNWDRVKDLPYSESVRGYIAANLELEDALTYMVQQLEEKGIADDTVIVLCGDHFPYGLDDGAGLGQMPYLSELYGHYVRDLLDRDSSRMILWSGCLEKEEPVTISDPVSSLDILPTLSNLFGTAFDSRLFPGRDVFAPEALPLVFDLAGDWKTDKGSYNGLTGVFTPDEENISADYISRISTIVRNKITYCDGLNSTDYFAHVLPGLAEERKNNQ